MRLRYIHIIFLLGFLQSTVGQVTIQPKGLEYEYKGIVYNEELAYNFTVHTNGIQFGADFGKLQTYYRTRYYHVSMGYLRHRAEERQNKNITLIGLGTSTSFIYGKRNTLLPIRAGVGVKRYFSEKQKRKGVAVGWNYELGPVLGLLIPYELVVIGKNPETGLAEPQRIIYKENPDAFLSYNNVFGSSFFASRWKEMHFRPGVQGKIGAHFSMGAFDKYVKALEVGAMVDYYFIKVPLIVENEKYRNSPIFLNLYVTLQLGKRK